MIVSVNEKNQNNYIDLFTKAYNALVDADKMEPNDNGRLTSLSEYYAHMADLIDIDKAYALVPLDEEPFEINANDRTIKVPANFAKCASVQSDHYAEMVVFTIDRYFDFTDLGADTEIWVQWTAPAEKGATSETKASVCFKDETNTTDKLRFGWLLTSEVTRVPGNVKFSVRIFRRDKDGKIVYSFNTLTSDLVVKPVLDPALAGDVNVDNPIEDSAFKAAVVNSMYAPNGGPLPIVPSFGAPGLNFEKGAIAGLVEDTLTLEAQAVVPDTGVIDYTWHYSADGSVWNNCADINHGTIGVAYKAIKADNEDKEAVADTEAVYNTRVLQEKYFELVEGEYVPFTGLFPVEGKRLYECVSTYTVPAAGTVTGFYKAGAANTVGNNTTKVVYTNTCKLPAPKAVVYTTNLENNVTLKDNKATLAVAVADDEGKPTMTYTWKYNGVNPDLVESDEGTVGEAEHEVTTPGWYCVESKATLNREFEATTSNVCRVTAPVAPLTLNRVATETWPDATSNNVVVNATDRDKEYELKVEINETLPDLLISDEYAFIWEIQENPEDSGFAIVNENTSNYLSGLGTDTLKVKYSDAYQNYRCSVVNTLNGQTALSNGVQFILYGAPAEQ